MRKIALPIAALLAASAPLAAGEIPAAAPSPAEIVDAAPQADWVRIPPDDLLVMDLADDARGLARRVVIQLMPPPFSQGWIGNIRKLAAAHWWDGTSVNRVQDNYVVQWGDAEAEDPAKARPLPPGLTAVPESGYAALADGDIAENAAIRAIIDARRAGRRSPPVRGGRDPYGFAVHYAGWPLSSADRQAFWPVHCYGMVGVGRNMPPDTGSGAELYAVIGHAPRHLDGNIALVGRVIEGIEHLSSLPRGTGPLGFYEAGAQRVAIRSVRIGTAVAGLSAYEYLSTGSQSFARYAEARANRRDAFFIRPAGGADICNIPVPVRRVR